jgi:hypothetical protein
MYKCIYTGRQDGSGARGKRRAWRGCGCADWSGHGGGAVAGRERLLLLGHLCVCVYVCLVAGQWQGVNACFGLVICVYVCMCAWVYVGSEGGM